MNEDDEINTEDRMVQHQLQPVNDSVRVGDYGLGCTYSDSDPFDPWFIGFVRTISMGARGICSPNVQFEGGYMSRRRYFYFKHLTKEEGATLMARCKDHLYPFADLADHVAMEDVQ
jgi:hypothetical protein